MGARERYALTNGVLSVIQGRTDMSIHSLQLVELLRGENCTVEPRLERHRGQRPTEQVAQASIARNGARVEARANIDLFAQRRELDGGRARQTHLLLPGLG